MTVTTAVAAVTMWAMHAAFSRLSMGVPPEGEAVHFVLPRKRATAIRWRHSGLLRRFLLAASPQNPGQGKETSRGRGTRSGERPGGSGRIEGQVPGNGQDTSEHTGSAAACPAERVERPRCRR